MTLEYLMRRICKESEAAWLRAFANPIYWWGGFTTNENARGCRFHVARRDFLK